MKPNVLIIGYNKRHEAQSEVIINASFKEPISFKISERFEFKEPKYYPSKGSKYHN